MHKILQRVEAAREQCKRDTQKEHPGKHICANSLTISVSSQDDALIDRQYYDYFTLKSLKLFIMYHEKLSEEQIKTEDWIFKYSINGQVDIADNARQWMMRHEENDWCDQGWIDARNYWDVDVTQEDLFR